MKNDYTPDEPWSIKLEPGWHWYNAQKDYALNALKPGKILVIGSPIFEALAFREAGFEVTYCDVRNPPVQFDHMICANAATAEFGTNVYDCASSTCVLCHAGMGRYGDEVIEDADRRILQNVWKALKDGGKMAVMFGPVYKAPKTMPFNNAHKIYSIADAVQLVEPFIINCVNVFSATDGKWTNCINDKKCVDNDYLSMVLEKFDA